MSDLFPIVRLARVTIETRSALSIGSGTYQPQRDCPVVRDANGLPAIPGTTLAGVLRHLNRARTGDERATSELFGSVEGGPSRIEVSWAHIHEEHDRPVDGLELNEARLQKDGILGHFLGESSPYRDRVRISERGAAAYGGRFDRDIVHKGHRFTFEMALWQAQPDPREWRCLLAQLKNPLFRLGGAVRSGLGRCAVIAIRETVCDLRTDFERYAKLPRRLDDHSGFLDVTAQIPAVTDQPLAARVVLVPCDYWHVGGGKHSVASTAAGRKPADRKPLTELCVVWNGAPGAERGTMSKRMLLVSAAGVKGALRHRTGFHLRRLRGDMIDLENPPASLEEAARKAEPELDQLFGAAKRRDDRACGSNVQAGALMLEDVYVDPDALDDVVKLDNIGIDRFTGGTQHGRLFDAEMPHGGAVELSFLFIRTDGIAGRVVRAFDLALRDLCEGRLAIGAGSARGHGYCLSPAGVQWSEPEQWKRMLT